MATRPTPVLRHAAAPASAVRLPRFPVIWDIREHLALAGYVVRWALFALPIGLITGSAVALFLWALDRATATRLANPWLLWWLPAAGLLVGTLYQWLGRAVEGGNNLIVDEIHEPGGGVPARMAPLVLVATVVTHLFGGSAGREGTAVQMGGAVASAVGRTLRLDAATTRTVLTAGIAAGFGAVFGTPLAGAVFALEVLAVGRMDYAALVPCLLASLVGDWTCAAWGIRHTAYHVDSLRAAGVAHLDVILLGKTALAAAAFGVASAGFAELTHAVGQAARRLVRRPALRPVAGGALVVALVYLVGTRDYIGLGVTAPAGGVSITSSFHAGGAAPWSWWWKMLFTAVTLGFGFKGGEVTPLFFVGAALGNVVGTLMGAPVDLFAALGFVAVFAGATNTPLACTLMGVELFGADAAVYLAAACFLAYVFSGHSGIYLSQRIATPKGDGRAGDAPASLRAARTGRRAARPRRAASGEHRAAARDGAPHPQPRHLMSDAHHIHPRRVGHLRVYLAAGERRRGRGLRRLLFGKSLYAEIIDAAKADGVPHAVAHTTLYGYTGGGAPQHDTAEGTNGRLTLCVELIGPTALLDAFIRRHGDLLAGKTIVHKDAEHWDVFPTAPATPADVGPRAGAPDDTGSPSDHDDR